MSTVLAVPAEHDLNGNRARLRERNLHGMRALAQRVNARRQEYIREHGTRLVISSPMSRILEHDPDYLPYRRRKQGRRHKQVTNIGVFSLQRMAAELGTTVGNLLGEQPHLLSVAQRRDLRRCVIFLIRLFDLNAPDVRGRDAAAAP